MSTHKLRLSIAAEAARIMATEQVADYQVAKDKARERLRLPTHSPLPSNTEIQQALRSYQQLFLSDRQAGALRELRQTALRWMQRLERFSPRLVGAVLDGTADTGSVISLHVFADSTKEIALALFDWPISYTTGERRVRTGRGQETDLPLFRITEADHIIELTVFNERNGRQRPLSHVDGLPVQRADAGALRTLLEPGPA
ncbi:MAG: hypothetical protein KDG50_14295 [Chromatiales bacterium]|nr:hypothetical protein [Chromatiales bacterium]